LTAKKLHGDAPGPIPITTLSKRESLSGQYGFSVSGSARTIRFEERNHRSSLSRFPPAEKSKKRRPSLRKSGQVRQRLLEWYDRLKELEFTLTTIPPARNWPKSTKASSASIAP
jgi:hypothetical protein